MHSAEKLRHARWFGGKSRAIAETHTVDSVCWASNAELHLIEVVYASGEPDTYLLADGLEEPDVARAVLDRFAGATLRTATGGLLEFRPTHIFHSLAQQRREPVRLLRGEQSNTSIRFGDALVLKLFRRLQFGPNPDVEVGWFLTEHTAFRGTPPLAGSLTYTTPDGRAADLALLQQFEPNRGDAWTTTLARVRDVLNGADMAESIGTIRCLGRTTAEMHLALASGAGDFAAQPVTADDIQAWSTTLAEEIREVLHALESRGRGRTIDSRALLARASGLRQLEGALKARHHGDYHLGQILERDDGAFAIIDFEGEPSRPLAQRRERRTPLRDVAGMLRSFDYARHTADPTHSDLSARWYATAREVFLDAYLHVVKRLRGLVPDDIEPVLSALELEKAAYEVMYELNNRPDWVSIPLAAFTSATL